MFQQPGTAPNTGWAFMYGITSIMGAWGGGTLGQSDWTRYASRRYAPTVSQLFASPVTIAVTAIIGIVVTSAARDILGGALLWNPVFLLAKIQDHYQSSPGARAGVFFASTGLVFSQLSVRAFWRSNPPTSAHRAFVDLARAQRHELWHGHGWALAQVHQHQAGRIHHGDHRHRDAVSGLTPVPARVTPSQTTGHGSFWSLRPSFWLS